MSYKVTVSSKLKNGFPMVMTVQTGYAYAEDAIDRAHALVETMRESGRTDVHALVTESMTTIMVVD